MYVIAAGESGSNLSLPVFVLDQGQPGTEIFNMPASTNAGVQLLQLWSFFLNSCSFYTLSCFLRKACQITLHTLLFL